MKVSIAFATKVRLVSESIKESLQARGYDTRGVMADPERAVDWLSKVRPYFLVIDSHCSVELIREVRAKELSREIILLSDELTYDWVRIIEIHRIRGVVSFFSSFAELTFCIQEIVEGRRYVSEAVRTAMEQGREDPLPETAPIRLTTREGEILTLVGKGYTNAQIGQALFLSPNTVNNHRANISRKLDLKGANQLMKAALSRNQ